jgi:hypothetical protein
MENIPDGPDAVDLTVVEEEGWVTWGGEEITTWVTVNGEVTTTVNTNGSRARNTLHDELEIVDVLVVEDQAC